MEFLTQEYWTALLCPPSGDLPDPEIKLRSPVSPALSGGFSICWDIREPLTNRVGEEKVEGKTNKTCGHTSLGRLSLGLYPHFMEKEEGNKKRHRSWIYCVWEELLDKSMKGKKTWNYLCKMRRYGWIILYMLSEWSMLIHSTISFFSTEISPK